MKVPLGEEIQSPPERLELSGAGEGARGSTIINSLFYSI